MVTLESKKKDYNVSLPTSIEEVIPTLEGLVKNINLPEHYAIIALCFRTKLFDFTLASKKNKDLNLTVTPILAKFNSGDKNYDYLQVGLEVITNRAALELGTDAHIPTVASANILSEYINNDLELIQYIQRTPSLPQVVLLGFKIVPINSISATVKHKATIDDVYKVTALRGSSERSED